MVLSVTALLLTSIVSITLILNWDNAIGPLYYARIIGNALPQIILAFFVWICLFSKKIYGFNTVYWKYSLGFGLPMVFHMLSQQILGQADRVMMQMLNVDIVEIGIYSFFYSFVNILSVILSALNNSWCPLLYDNLYQKDFKRLNEKVENYVQVFTILCSGFLMVSREFSILFTNSEYWIGMPIIPVLVLAVYCTFVYQFAVNYELYHSKPTLVAIGTIIAAISNIVFNGLLIPFYGMYGAGIATLLSYVILAIMHTGIINIWKIEKYPLSYGPIINGIILILVFCVLYYILGRMVIIRWVIGSILGIYLIKTIYHRKMIF